MKPFPALLALIGSACVSAPPEGIRRTLGEPELEGFVRAVDSLRVEARIPGLSLAVVRSGEVVLARGLGYADPARRVPATPETPYDIASVSKPLSAVVALHLVEEGVLELDAPMTRYRDWTEFCGEYMRQRTIFTRDLRCDTEPLTLRHLLSMTANDRAGSRFFYHPVLFSWTSRPMAEAAGEPFSALVERHVFRRAGMERSARIHRSLPLRADLAAALTVPHRIDSTGAVVPAPPPPPQGDGAAGGVVSTVLDLARFDVALDGGRLVSAESRRAMLTPARSSVTGEELGYGLGMFVQRHEGRTVAWHSGWWPDAYSALYLKLPEDELTLILLANSEGLWWNNPLDAARVEGSPFARAFFRSFLGRGRATRMERDRVVPERAVGSVAGAVAGHHGPGALADYEAEGVAHRLAAPGSVASRCSSRLFMPPSRPHIQRHSVNTYDKAS